MEESLEFFAGLCGRPLWLSSMAGLYGRAADQERSMQSTWLTGQGLVPQPRQGLSPAGRPRPGPLNDPAILCLDKPTSDLDPVAAHELHDLTNGLRARGVNIFFTTHRIEKAEPLWGSWASVCRLRRVESWHSDVLGTYLLAISDRACWYPR